MCGDPIVSASRTLFILNIGKAGKTKEGKSLANQKATIGKEFVRNRRDIWERSSRCEGGPRRTDDSVKRFSYYQGSGVGVQSTTREFVVLTGAVLHHVN